MVVLGPTDIGPLGRPVEAGMIEVIQLPLIGAECAVCGEAPGSPWSCQTPALIYRYPKEVAA